MSDLRPIVLIGAARSGTKILRDTLSAATGIPTVPYDVGYIWRYGNDRTPHDALAPELLGQRANALIRRFVGSYADERGYVLEKTVGNALRVPFVARALPEAVFIHLVRDGVAVTESAVREWQKPTDWRYVLEKSRHFPLRLAPTYGGRFVVAQTIGRKKNGGHVSTWGPRYAGIDEDLSERGLFTVCARQWRESEMAARRDLAAVNAEVVDVRYEDLVAEPLTVILAIANKLELPLDREGAEPAAAAIRPQKGLSARERLSSDERVVLKTELSQLLEELGYDQP